MSNHWVKLISELKTGSIPALSKLITRIENREPGWMDAMKQIFPLTGKAKLIGITGSPGAGKSTLTNKVASRLAERGFAVGVIAVDPSSPFSGGAILGDRVRMHETSALENVFIRSMATRGALGGLNQSVRDVSKIMDAFGKDFVIIETVGVGQDEIDVVKTADVVIVVCVPGQGDEIQAIKAGIMEIADIFVVNKADREGADDVVSDITSMIEFSSRRDQNKPHVIKTVATEGNGVGMLIENILSFLNSVNLGQNREKDKIRAELVELLEREIYKHLMNQWNHDGNLDDTVVQVMAHEKDPYSIIEELIAPLNDLFKR